MTTLLLKHPSKYIIILLLSLTGCATTNSQTKQNNQNSILIHAARVFDGHSLRTDTSLLISNGKVIQVDRRAVIHSEATKVIDLGDATILPGFIELHAHLAFQKVPEHIVLKHGITTIRDLGGPLHQPYGGDGSLRVLTAGSIITAPHGYPIPIFGLNDSVIPVTSEDQARKIVNDLVEGGAVVIKVALEPGGEAGAPWASGHHNHGHNKNKHNSHHQWPLLSEEIVTAIVDEAHKLNRKVTAHIGEAQGAEIALNSGVDEWAHMPCAVIPENLLSRAVEQQVTIISTIDTLSKCAGIFHNTKRLASLGAEILYGAEIAHPDIPWGIDTQELNYLKKLGNLSAIDTLKTVTSKAGKHLNYPLLGTLQSGAPADIIAVKGNPLEKFKRLEYPDLVISGGKVIVNNF